MRWNNYIEDRNRLFWLVHTAGWLGFALIHYLGSLLHELRDIFVVIIFLNTYSGWLLTIPLRYFYQRIWYLSLVKMALTTILVSYLVGVVWQVVKNATFWEIYRHGYKPEFWLYYTESSVWSFYVILGWSVLYFGSRYYQMLQKEKQLVLQANAVAHQAQLKMLRYQLNPHFLFNTLNAISTLILIKDNDKANTMVTKLSEFLRFSLDNDPMKKVTLLNEVHALQLYLAIEKVRFTDRSQLELHIEENCQLALVPSMILQPIAENAIKHAIAVQEQGGCISVTVRRMASDLLLEITDDGPGADIVDGHISREHGIGLVNTRERLQALYQNKASLVMANQAPSGVKVTICMPFELID